MRKVAVAAAGLVLAGCSKASVPPDNTAAISALSARVTALEGRVTTLETKAKQAASAASEPVTPVPPQAELRVLDGFNSPPHDYPTMEACMRAKAVIEAQFAEKEAAARAQGSLFNAGTASCLSL